MNTLLDTTRFTYPLCNSDEQYNNLYKQSVTDPSVFWEFYGKSLHWFTPYTQIKNTSFNKNNIQIQWFYDGTTNASYNCLDRHLETKSNHTAIIWEPDATGNSRSITYKKLSNAVNQFANALKNLNLSAGDVAIIYMPMIIESCIAMLACSRLGIVHSVVFGGFSAVALRSRIEDCQAKIIITSDEGKRSGKIIPLKKNVDDALKTIPNPSVKKVIIYQHTHGIVDWNSNRDISWDTAIKNCDTTCPAVELNAEHPLFILYTSGSTGTPKGIVHTTGGYLVYAAMTFHYIFNYQPQDIYWCTADIGWITGHSYVIYGPLLNGATVVLHEGTPNYPNASRLGEIIDKYHVNILYTAPTTIRALMATGEQATSGSHRSSLKIIGSVGEPLNPEAWSWYQQSIGNANAQVVDTWWQTETGGIMISPLPNTIPPKPGSVLRPFFGIQPVIVDDKNTTINDIGEGKLAILNSWPGQARSIYNNRQRFIDTYFSTVKNCYFTGDGARRDEQGHFWITGRMDDVVNVSGHRLGTAEIESALVSHEYVAEAAAIGIPDPIRGQAILAYVTLNKDVPYNKELKQALKNWIRKQIGAIATPKEILWAPDLPKTRSGKIMRRILKKIYVKDYDLGDTSTLADPTVVERLITETKT